MSQFSQNIVQRVAHFIAQQRLLPASTVQVFIGLSGGPDSVALLHILHTLGYHCKALHCNFQLRGQESDRDEQFCRQLCQMLDIPIEIKTFDTRAYMKRHHLSLEMAARELRYQWWNEMQNARIALGHHQDDSIETVLMNLMRGTGIHGLTGIVPHNEASHVVRPLLCLSRQDIIDYLLDNGLSYVIDSTNAENDTMRNQIRNQLLPLMEQIAPQVRMGIAQTIEHLKGTAYFADRMLEEYDYLTEHHAQWGIEWDELSIDRLKQHFHSQHIEDYLFDWQRRYGNSSMLRTVRTNSLVYTSPTDDAVFERHRPQLATRTANRQPGDALPKTPTDSLTATFDAASFTPPLTLRRWQEGDRMAPIGMNGHTKLVSDLFSNAHYTPMQKATTWLLTDASGAILWVVGLRMSERNKVSDATREICCVTVTG